MKMMLSPKAAISNTAATCGTPKNIAGRVSATNRGASSIALRAALALCVIVRVAWPRTLAAKAQIRIPAAIATGCNLSAANMPATLSTGLSAASPADESINEELRAKKQKGSEHHGPERRIGVVAEHARERDDADDDSDCGFTEWPGEPRQNCSDDRRGVYGLGEHKRRQHDNGRKSDGHAIAREVVYLCHRC